MLFYFLGFRIFVEDVLFFLFYFICLVLVFRWMMGSLFLIYAKTRQAFGKRAQLESRRDVASWERAVAMVRALLQIIASKATEPVALEEREVVDPISGARQHTVILPWPQQRIMLSVDELPLLGFQAHINHALQPYHARVSQRARGAQPEQHHAMLAQPVVLEYVITLSTTLEGWPAGLSAQLSPGGLIHLDGITLRGSKEALWPLLGVHLQGGPWDDLAFSSLTLRAGELSLMMRRDMALELVNDNLIAEHARALLPNVRDFERATAQLTWRGGATLSETLASWAEEVARAPDLAAQLVEAIAAQPQDDPHITRARETILSHIGAKGLTVFDAIQAHAPSWLHTLSLDLQVQLLSALDARGRGGDLSWLDPEREEERWAMMLPWTTRAAMLQRAWQSDRTRAMRWWNASAPAWTPTQRADAWRRSPACDETFALACDDPLASAAVLDPDDPSAPAWIDALTRSARTLPDDAIAQDLPTLSQLALRALTSDQAELWSSALQLAERAPSLALLSILTARLTEPPRALNASPPLYSAWRATHQSLAARVDARVAGALTFVEDGVEGAISLASAETGALNTPDQP